MKLRIKVVPGAARSEIAGWLGDTLKVRVNAPPERGRANTAVIELLAEALDLPSDAVTITAGASAARKIVEITGRPDAELRRQLEIAMRHG